MNPLRFFLPALTAALLLGGCGNSADSVPAHSETEQKAIDAQAKLTPQQRIEQIQNSPLPPGAKTDMIAKIKSENGIK